MRKKERKKEREKERKKETEKETVTYVSIWYSYICSLTRPYKSFRSLTQPYTSLHILEYDTCICPPPSENNLFLNTHLAKRTELTRAVPPVATMHEHGLAAVQRGRHKGCTADNAPTMLQRKRETNTQFISVKVT